MVYATNLSSSGTLWNGSYYGKHHNAFLLSERDELVIGSSVVLVFSSEKYLDSVRKPEVWSCCFDDLRNTDISDCGLHLREATA